MARRKLPSFNALWARHESIYVEVFTIALRELTDKLSVSGDEDAISELLRMVLNEVCFKIGQAGDSEIRVPDWEKPCQPVSNNELTGGKKNKCPDFTCSFYNGHTTRPEYYEIPFHIECKRLGNPTSSSWNLNKNYVVKGIKRFDSQTHKYGKRAPSGMMIGYIISLSPQSILTEVNRHQVRHLQTWPDITFTWSGGLVHQTEQSFQRQHVTPADFRLIHIWADLRHNYLANVP